MDTTLLLTLLVQVVLPVVVGLATKQSYSPRVKFVLLAVLTALNTGIQGYLGGSTLQEVLLTGAIGLLAAIGSHYGFYKPAGVSEAVSGILVKDDAAPDDSTLAEVPLEDQPPKEEDNVGSEDAEAAIEEDATSEPEQAVSEEADPSEEAEV